MSHLKNAIAPGVESVRLYAEPESVKNRLKQAFEELNNVNTPA
jgi:hypothetical protein